MHKAKKLFHKYVEIPSEFVLISVNTEDWQNLLWTQ
jgi:hypothetical protein